MPAPGRLAGSSGTDTRRGSKAPVPLAAGSLASGVAPGSTQALCTFVPALVCPQGGLSPGGRPQLQRSVSPGWKEGHSWVKSKIGAPLSISNEDTPSLELPPNLPAQTRFPHPWVSGVLPQEDVARTD